MKRNPSPLEHLSRQIKAIQKKDIGHILKIGQLLEAAAARCEHGQFTTWIETEFDFSIQQARRYRQVAAFAEDHQFGDFDDLNISPSALYILADPTMPVAALREILRKAKTEFITHKRAQAILAKHRVAPDEDASADLEGGDNEIAKDSDAERHQVAAELQRSLEGLLNVANSEFSASDLPPGNITVRDVARIIGILNQIKNGLSGHSAVAEKADRAEERGTRH